MVASIQLSYFRASLVLLPSLWDRCNCVAEMQTAVESFA